MTAGVPDIRTSCFRPWRSMPAWNGGMRALEVGIGTGQATRPFLEAGCRVTAVELGEKLAAYSQVKFQNFFNLEILQGDFMKCPLQGDSFDLLYSATAFHWIPEEQGYPKALRLLKAGERWQSGGITPARRRNSRSCSRKFRKCMGGSAALSGNLQWSLRKKTVRRSPSS